jgi:NAD(P)H-nitrite reductase large subunit
VDNKTLTPGVFGFRTLHDTMAMMRYARGKQRAAVIGGGLDIGVPSPEVGAAELADETQVCNCNEMSKDQLATCVRDG